ncbi:hypothetical protein [Desulfovibrio intestinalis]|uniref:Uncharacterized protein n=1 Tax=Desulfovibrio intestinalis TaxID=58621 RepID=A0A7W8C0X7_9BACT|nr:hypothetical protein [Desulfovibrio intestinalis]MBB5143236.1 hypothetical protein [Desulfovibrio intestinalis]
MRLSVDNRHRIVLLFFVIIDHFIWLYGGHWEQASFVYVIMTECIRIFVGIAFVASFFYKKILEFSVKITLTYCLVMMVLNIFGYSSDGMSFFSSPGATPNVLFFKKDRFVPIDHALLAALLYLYFLLCAYFFSGKYINQEILAKSR